METMGTEEIRSRLITITCAVFFLIAFFGHKGAVLAFTKIDTKRKLRQSLSLHSNEKESTWILLAEGEQSLRNKMGKYISNEGGHVVTGVADATSTILVCRGTVRPKEMQSIDNSTRYPDCLVLDAQLPGTINGLDLLKVIRTDESLKFLPVILFGESERANGYDGEPDAYLTKPFDLDELLSVIDSVTKTGRFTGRLMPNRAVEINNSVIKADELRQELSDIKSLLVKSGFNMTNIFNTTNDTNSHSIQKDLREIKQTVQNRYTQAKPTDVYRKKVCTEHVTNQGEFLVDTYL